MIEVDLIPVASPIHQENYWRKKLDAIIHLMLKHGFKINLYGCIKSAEEAEKVEISPDANAVLIGVLTGGTSSIAARIATKIEKAAIILAHNSGNSLPSAIEAREKAKLLGVHPDMAYLNLEKPNQVANELRNLKAIIKTIHEITSLKAIDVGGKNRTLNIGAKGKLEIIGLDEEAMENTRRRVNKESINKVLNKVLEQAELHEVSVSDLKESVKLYLAAKQLMNKNNAKIVMFNCFKYIEKYGITPCLTVSLLNSEGLIGICESDEAMTISYVLSKNLSAIPPIICNTSSFNPAENTLILAHCTAPLKSSENGKKIKLVKHFESQKSVSLDVKTPINTEVILLSLSRELGTLHAAEGVIIDSSIGLEDMCRTQIKVKLKGDVWRFIDNTPSNHQLLVFHDNYRAVKRIAKLVGIKFSSIHFQ